MKLIGIINKASLLKHNMLLVALIVLATCAPSRKQPSDLSAVDQKQVTNSDASISDTSTNSWRVFPSGTTEQLWDVWGLGLKQAWSRLF